MISKPSLRPSVLKVRLLKLARNFRPPFSMDFRRDKKDPRCECITVSSQVPFRETVRKRIERERERRERNILAVRKIMAEKVGARSKKDSHSLVRMNIQGFSGVQCSPVHSTGTNIVGPDSHWTGPFFNFFFPLCIFFHEQESSACSRTSSPPTFRHRFRGKGFTTTARLCLAECGTILS